MSRRLSFRKRQFSNCHNWTKMEKYQAKYNLRFCMRNDRKVEAEIDKLTIIRVSDADHLLNNMR